MYVRINKKMVGICINKDAKNFQNFLVRPFLAIFGHFWPFLGIFGHNLGSTNVSKLVLVSNIMFCHELSEKNF